jgi:FK506-binding protein 4/5
LIRYSYTFFSFSQEKESWDLKSNPEKIEAAAKKKEEGNVWFKMGKYAKASKRYEKVGQQAFN